MFSNFVPAVPERKITRNLFHFCGIEQNQSDHTQRKRCQVAFFLNKNATWEILPGYTYSDFALDYAITKITDL
jgi:hypothetical protein